MHNNIYHFSLQFCCRMDNHGIWNNFSVVSSKSRKKKHANGIGLVESGMYAFARHSEFLGHILIIFALVIISQHWINFIVGAILIVLLHLAIIEEEKRNMEKFGNAYRDYKRVPRINLTELLRFNLFFLFLTFSLLYANFYSISSFHGYEYL